MKANLRFVLILAAVALMLIETASAGWTPYIIRNASSGGAPPVIQPNDDYVPGATEFIISAAGQKAAWGTSALDGQTVGSMTQLAIDRLDDRTRFTQGSGPYVAPYINIWITDGAGKYAVIANEPSDAAFQPLYDNGYDLSWTDLADKVVKVYENSDKTWLPNNGVGLTFADVTGYQIQAPSVAELAAGWPGLGTGAPRELGTNLAYGINWVFGDTLSNYVSGDEGYVVAEPFVVPEPACVVLFGLAAVGLLLLRRRRG
jgi:hypothetical protein